MVDTPTLALILALVVHTAALFFAGGQAWRLLKSHDRYITKLSEWKHDEVTPRLFKVDELWRNHESKGGSE